MDIFRNFMENTTANILLDGLHLPELIDCDILTASENFFHMDRTADFNVLICVTDGAMYVTENGRDYEIPAGGLLFLRSGLRHYGRRETPRGTRWFYAHFRLPEPPHDMPAVAIAKAVSPTDKTEPERADETGTGAGGADAEAAAETGTGAGGAEPTQTPVLALPKQCALPAGATEQMERLCALLRGSSPLHRLRAGALFYELLLRIGEGQPEEPRPIDAVCAYLTEHAREPFNKERTAANFLMSYSRLAALFKEEKGIPMGEYHNRARMEAACRLLRSTLLPVGEVADRLGFADPLYFSKKFRAFAGLSPAAYRRLSQQKY